MTRRPPRSTRPVHPCPTRRSADRSCGGRGAERGRCDGTSQQSSACNIGHASIGHNFSPDCRNRLQYNFWAVVHKIRAVSSDEMTDSRSEEHTSELQSLMRISYAVFCLTKKNKNTNTN